MLFIIRHLASIRPSPRLELFIICYLDIAFHLDYFGKILMRQQAMTSIVV